MTERNESPGQRDCEEIILDPTREKLVFKASQILRHPLHFLGILSPFLTAHHPFCEPFQDHVFEFRGRTWCFGCVFNSISFATALVILTIMWFLDSAVLDRRILFYGGVIGLVVYFFSGALHLTENRKVKALSKFVLGTSFASICLAILMIGGDIYYLLTEKIVLIFLMYMMVIVILNGKRAWETYKTCDECEYKMRWSKCPGFKDIVCEFVEEGFIQPKDKPTI